MTKFVLKYCQFFSTIASFLQILWKTRGNSQRVYQPFATYIYGNREADCEPWHYSTWSSHSFTFIFLSVRWTTVTQLAERRDRNLLFLGKTRALWFCAQSWHPRFGHNVTQRYLMNHRWISEHRSVILAVYIPI